jgi:hypothetical protein
MDSAMAWRGASVDMGGPPVAAPARKRLSFAGGVEDPTPDTIVYEETGAGADAGKGQVGAFSAQPAAAATAH